MKIVTCLQLLFLMSFTLSCSSTEVESETPSLKLDTNKVMGINDYYTHGTKSIVFNSEREDYIIGNIQGAKLNDGQIYIIDNIIPNLLVVNKDGTLINKIGRSGRGPGEYINPTSIEISKGELILLDQSIGRITRYVYNLTNEEYVMDISGTHNFRMSDLCMHESGDIWVYGLKDNNIIHRLSKDLQTVSYSMGMEFDNSDRITLESAQNGVIECSSEFIFTGFRTDNKVRVHRKSNGLLYQEIKFDEIVPVEISIMTHNGQVGFARKYYQGQAYDERGNYHDSLSNIILIDDELLVQYQRYFFDADSDSQKIISFIVNLLDNSYEMIMTLPIIFDYEYKKTLLAGSNHPLPSIKLINLMP